MVKIEYKMVKTRFTSIFELGTFE